MMTSPTVILTLAIPVGLAGIIGLILLSGSLKPSLRRGLELFLLAIFYPVFILFFGWQTVRGAVDGDMFGAVLNAVLVGLITFQGWQLMRRRTRADGTRT